MGKKDRRRHRSGQTLWLFARPYSGRRDRRFQIASCIPWPLPHRLVNGGRTKATCHSDKSGNPDLGLVVRIALASGARQAEILYLRWRMLDLPHECAFLPTSKRGSRGLCRYPAMSRTRCANGLGCGALAAIWFSLPEDSNQPRNIRQQSRPECGQSAAQV